MTQEGGIDQGLLSLHRTQPPARPTRLSWSLRGWWEGASRKKRIVVILLGILAMPIVFHDRGDRYVVADDDGGKRIRIVLKKSLTEDEVCDVAKSAARARLNTPGRMLGGSPSFWVDVDRIDSSGDPRPHIMFIFPTAYASIGDREVCHLLYGAKHEFDLRPSRSLLTTLACPQDHRLAKCVLDNFKESALLAVRSDVSEAEAVRFSEEIARDVGQVAPTETFAVTVYTDPDMRSLVGEARYDPQTRSVLFKRFR